MEEVPQFLLDERRGRWATEKQFAWMYFVPTKQQPAFHKQVSDELAAVNAKGLIDYHDSNRDGNTSSTLCLRCFLCGVALSASAFICLYVARATALLVTLGSLCGLTGAISYTEIVESLWQWNVLMSRKNELHVMPRWPYLSHNPIIFLHQKPYANLIYTCSSGPPLLQH